ncbi:aminoglycoside phosphotransferase family protein [Pseudonocardia nigra]|uniref:aminoglycoside phosphotransferase family protein n=1 Tax=Pseudonocardia nigra TaxID=1921578 RepID=UPI001C601466|nr:aminoglycoside phosphotransferase family protein [Pseudonocardia nigra]
MSAPADTAWLAQVGRWAGGPVTVGHREPLAGGYVSAQVERVTLDASGRAVDVVVKRASATEVAAMRALAVIPGLERPRQLATGRDAESEWLVLPFYAGPGLGADAEVPAEVWTALGRVHAHWHRKRPRGVPVVDAAWWRTTVRERTLPAVLGAGERTGDPLFPEVAALLEAWATDSRLLAALAVLPRTLTHGDAHRGNVLLAADGAVLIDWGNARVAPAGLDLATLAAQGAPAADAYAAAVANATPPPELREVERLWAQVQVHVQYLGFAADHLGSARVAEMVQTAVTALDALGPALDAARRARPERQESHVPVAE